MVNANSDAETVRSGAPHWATEEHGPGPGAAGLTPGEELLLQQLRQAQFWAEKNGGAEGNEAAGDSADQRGAVAVPQSWELTRGLALHDWQEACVRAWLANGMRGVMKVVTGAGKTILALAIAERLQQTERHSLRVAVVVPTIVLLNQWRDELAAHGNLPASAIGLMGGGHGGRFSESTRVLICVLNSAAKKLAAEVERAGVGQDLLLVVDECHRAGATEMKQVFATQRAYSLGLSATPERTDDPAPDAEEEAPAGEPEEPASFEESVLGRELGPVVFEMTYADAIRRGVLPPFRIVHYGLSLGPRERERYDRLSREIKELRDELETGSRRGLALVRWCRSRAGARNPRAVQFLALTAERKRLLYRIGERFQAVEAILRRAFAENPNTRAILFHESIDEVMGLFGLLRRAGYAVVAEHSEFPDAMRAESLRLFRDGTARVIVSARSLIEGFNVPSADLGIVVAASASVRQRVQTLGRLLRRIRNQQGAEKQATLYVLYAAGTVDELIYEKADWEQFVGAERNDYFLWHPVAKSEPKPQPGPPRRPPVDELKIDANTLVPGGPYPGDSDQGLMYSLDTQGTVRDENGNLVEPNEQLRQVLANYRKAGGRFRVTPRQRFVTRLEKTADGWQAVYLGRLDEPLRAAEVKEANGVPAVDYAPCAPYPLSQVKGQVFSVLQRDKRLIARKLRGRVQFIVPAEKLADPHKEAALRQIQKVLADVYARGHRISKITVTGAGHVVYVVENQAYFVGHAPEGAEGFVFEKKDKTTP
jgi:superfamily II DNA or RNA helicase